MKEEVIYALHSTTPAALVKMRSHTEAYETTVLGLSIIVLPDVWSPAYDWSSAFYAENLPDLQGRDFLEIGCGTGVLSVFAARLGAKRIVSVDVNEAAVANAKLNFKRFDIQNADAVQSNIFSEVRGEFDVVTWNAPYHGCKAGDLLERGCADENYTDIRAFFRNVSSYLKPDGIVVFGFSESGDLPLIESLIDSNGFSVARKLSDWREGYNAMLFHLVRRSAPLA